MAYAILRVEKIHQKGEFCCSAAHLTRERECKNADPEKLHLNQTLYGAKTVAHAVALCQDQLNLSDRKVRKDAVTCLEYVITASPEWYKNRPQKEIDAYHKASLEWVKARHGKENVVMAVVHNDETTPHMHVFAVPMVKQTTKKGKEVYTLNAKSFTGNSLLLSTMQGDFAEKVGSSHGLERGIQGTTRHHQRVKSFYGTLDTKSPAPEVEVPKKGILEPHASYQKRAAEYVAEQQAGWAAATVTVERDRARKEAQVAAARALAERERVVEGREKTVAQREEAARKAADALEAEKRRVKAQEEAVAEARRQMSARETQLQHALRASERTEWLEEQLKAAQEEAAYYLHTCPLETIQRARQAPERPQAQRAPERRGRGIAD